MVTWTYGMFVWRELSTTDVDGALRFYGELFGWKSKVEQMPNGPYHQLMQGDLPVAGLLAVPQPGMPPGWMGYVSVPDVDAALAEARVKGGKVVWGPTDIEGVGRMGTFFDPQGAMLSVMRSTLGDPVPGKLPGAGQFCWEELEARDVEAAKTFYGAVLGWKPFPGPSARYTMLGMGARAGETAASLCAAPAGNRPAWRSFVLVGELRAVRERAARLGGKVLVEETVVPGVGIASTIADPQGAELNLFKAEAPTR